MNTYHERIEDIKASLVASRSRITLSMDGWSAPNDISLLGVVGHWIDQHCNLKTTLLGLRRLNAHDGSEIAEILGSIITDYKIEDKIAAFQMDNASNNDTALTALMSKRPSIWLVAEPFKQKRLRCFGHIINLVVKALLFGTRSSNFQKDLQEASDLESFKIWRQQGSIGHLHNIVTYISRSEQRLRDFEAAQRVAPGEIALHLVKDTGVRWNSTYSMIQRALRLQPAIQRYCREWRPANSDSYDLSNDFLDPQDWEELRHFGELLQPFERATKRVEGNAYTGSHGALWEVISIMDYLFVKLKKHSKEVTDRPKIFTDYYTNCLNHGFAKLSDYYTKIDESPYYAAAVALHPCKKFANFDTTWGPTKGGRDAIKIAKQSTRRLFMQYLDRAPSFECEGSSPTPLRTLSVDDKSEDEDEDWTNAFGDYTATHDHSQSS